MFAISVKKEWLSNFEEEEYIIDLHREFGGYKKGDLIICGMPFDCTGRFPLRLELAIRTDGSLVFRSWDFSTPANGYFHTGETPETFAATKEQIETVSGLFSGRIRFEGLRLAIGATVLKVCPVNIVVEETKTGEKIYLA